MQVTNGRKGSVENPTFPDFILVENNWDHPGCPTDSLAKDKQLLKKRQLWCDFSRFVKPFNGKVSLICKRSKRSKKPMKWELARQSS